jgi:hypothetical protein
MKMHVDTITINVLSGKFLTQAKTRSILEDWFKSELPMHLLYLKRIHKSYFKYKYKNGVTPVYLHTMFVKSINILIHGTSK